MQTKAIVAQPEGKGFTIENIKLDAPRDDEVLVEIKGVGLCHTDLAFSSGAAPFPLPGILGHEGAGIVQAVGKDVAKVSAGDHVVISFRSCGACDRCQTGDPAYCRTMPLLNYVGTRLDGTSSSQLDDIKLGSNFFGQSSFAHHALTYERNVVKVDTDLPLEIMGPLGCGVQTGAGGVMRSLAADAESSILILGGGAVGLSAVMGAKIQECSTIAVLEPYATRREMALSFGATHVLDPEGLNLLLAIQEIHPEGVDYIFDTTGNPDVIESAATCLGSKGVFGIVGICPPGTPVPGDLMNMITFGHTIKGIIEGDSDPDKFIPELINHYRQGRLPFDKMIKVYPFSEISAAVKDQQDGKCTKVVLIPD
ncbi:MAG: NAD(P)-dependent alcohol dehydrogenase [Gammaproteobacteria bacterium]|nr:NAD(P)-dependent alcohol dehydrogenase [Gammaproteobacteria bacterium]